MNSADLFSRHFNQAEAVLWGCMAIVFVWRFRHLGGQIAWQRWGVPLAFGVFGVSDWIESETGAWWDPWWLLMMKAACVATFGLAYWQQHQARKRPHQ